MVFCIVAMIVFGVLGIFSAKYRTYAREAFRCFARMATLRPCNTTFDEEMKAKITAKLIKRSPRLARNVHAHFGKISLVFAIVLFASLGYSAYGLYNLAVHGTCDPAHPDQCIFNPNDPKTASCPFENLDPSSAAQTIAGFMNIESANITKINEKPLVYFFTTTWCPHCKWEKPIFVNATSNFGKWTGIVEFAGDMQMEGAYFTSDYLTIKMFEIDRTDPPESDTKVFRHYSPQGYIPVLILGGKYYRVGSGENNGEAAETLALDALLCKISGSPSDVAVCSDPAVQEMTGRL
jgi:hypothetical protein